ncbi:MAG: ElyC/SanA/YdcF family protein [Synoicihabitans sp.]
MKTPKITLTKLLLMTVTGVLVGIWGIWDSDKRVRNAAADKTHLRLDSVPYRYTALVLGCSKHLSDGRANLFFRYRIDAAVALFEAGKMGAIIVSGDNSRSDYDESTDMHDALVERGVPESRIYRDYAGFSTLDSVVRAREIFGQDKITVISQQFHIERAVYIGEARGIDIIGFAAKDVAGRAGWRTHLREYLARSKAVLDLSILNRQPHFLGDKITIDS